MTTHASFTARRYEEFDTFEAFKTSFEAHKKSVERAEPILRKYKMQARASRITRAGARPSTRRG